LYCSLRFGHGEIAARRRLFFLMGQIFRRLCHARGEPPRPPAAQAAPLSVFTILQHLAPRRQALSRKFHTFHFPAICRVFGQLLLFAGLAQVGIRASCLACPQPAMGG
jgi:hypothetical protein